MHLWLCLLLLASPLWTSEGVEGWGVAPTPSESECRPYIEKALKEHTPAEAVDVTESEQPDPSPSPSDQEGSIEETDETVTKESVEDQTSGEAQTEGEGESTETGETTESESTEQGEDQVQEAQADNPTEDTENEDEGPVDEASNETEESKEEVAADQPSVEDGNESSEAGENIGETKDEDTTAEESAEETEKGPGGEDASAEDEAKSIEDEAKSVEDTTEDTQESTEEGSEVEGKIEEANEEETAEESSTEETKETAEESVEQIEETLQEATSAEDQAAEESVESPGGEVTDSVEATDSVETTESAETAEDKQDSIQETTETSQDEPADASKEDAAEASAEEPEETATEETTAGDVSAETPTEEETEVSGEAIDATATNETESVEEGGAEELAEQEKAEEEEVQEPEPEPEPTVEDQLTLEFEVPTVRRPRDHIAEVLRLTEDVAESDLLLAKTIESTLKELKRLYDSAIQPLEILFKYRDLSNRHFGDPEIFSKPLILFMGPWSGGKSTILNYLTDNEFKTSSIRTGAEPSPAYFNILMWGDRQEVLDGTQLAADWTFSGLQKFGQGLLDRLRGLRLNNPLLEKVNLVEIPGILEIRKQVERLFPFNDACQWFIDRADVIFLVYDPSKLDVGPETEAILDQLKGREYQTKIILNKADQVKPEELMRVQGTLIWNISPLMSSQEPPVMYSTSLWSVPYEHGAPSRLLLAQERAFLQDIRLAIDKRVENKIASARRFAVRVRNHAKMVDCYLTTYYNHKTFFGNRKKVADDIIEHPQNYHIYEGLSTLTNISRYDLPDPEVYRDFFRLNPLYDFQRLSDTCAFFRGCPINRLDRAIAYDLPELVGKYKKQAEKVLEVAGKS